MDERTNKVVRPKNAPHRANSRSHMRTRWLKGADGRGGCVQKRAEVIEPRRVQRDRRSAANPIGRAGHVMPRSRCSRRGHREVQRAGERTLFSVVDLLEVKKLYKINV